MQSEKVTFYIQIIQDFNKNMLLQLSYILFDHQSRVSLIHIYLKVRINNRLVCIIICI